MSCALYPCNVSQSPRFSIVGFQTTISLSVRGLLLLEEYSKLGHGIVKGRFEEHGRRASLQEKKNAARSRSTKTTVIMDAKGAAHHNNNNYSTMDAASLEAAEYTAKYRTYERDYLRRINHKYFSGKNLAGSGRVYDTVTSVDGFVVKESREPPIKRFLETPNSQEEQSSRSGGTPATKRHMTRKSQ